MTVLLCERTVAVSSQVAILCPRGHVPSVWELVIISQNLLQELCSANGNCIHSIPVDGPMSLFLQDLMREGDKGEKNCKSTKKNNINTECWKLGNYTETSWKLLKTFFYSQTIIQLLGLTWHFQLLFPTHSLFLQKKKNLNILNQMQNPDKDSSLQNVWRKMAYLQFMHATVEALKG